MISTTRFFCVDLAAQHYRRLHRRRNRHHSKSQVKIARKNNSSMPVITSEASKCNPFMVTSNQNYGISIGRLQLRQQRGEKDKIARSSPESVPDESLSFLYRRESDRIGERIAHSPSAMATIMSQERSRSSAAKRRACYISASLDKATHCGDQGNRKVSPSDEEAVSNALVSYYHNPRLENPLYTTTANEIGKKDPSAATYIAERKSRSQKFTNSFNGAMYSDEGLAH